tara:strand:- start:415 stop:1281 length:867 start_codon:yes stop_codon:yes gene_type:complete
MSHISIFLELTRLKKPIGYMLLFWPCVWGLTLAFNFHGNINQFIFFMLLFLSGSVLMRSAGCIVNDIADRNYDKFVERTKNRPIASGKITIKKSLIYVFLLCALAFLVLLNFNFFTILLALASMPLAFTYPLMKRFTYWPQLFLGITFNYGLILGWTSIHNEINIAPIILYIGAIFWTLGYDTIYGFQDIKDDEIIGVKSTSIKFKRNPKIFILLCYLILSISLITVGIIMNFSKIYFVSLLVPFLHLYSYQIYKFEKNDSNKCLKIFKSNNLLGIIIFINLLIGKIS